MKRFAAWLLLGPFVLAFAVVAYAAVLAIAGVLWTAGYVGERFWAWERRRGIL